MKEDHEFEIKEGDCTLEELEGGMGILKWYNYYNIIMSKSNKQQANIKGNLSENVNVHIILALKLVTFNAGGRIYSYILEITHVLLIDCKIRLLESMPRHATVS